jgi:hypothetical protein
MIINIKYKNGDEKTVSCPELETVSSGFLKNLIEKPKNIIPFVPLNIINFIQKI